MQSCININQTSHSETRIFNNIHVLQELKTLDTPLTLTMLSSEFLSCYYLIASNMIGKMLYIKVVKYRYFMLNK